MILALDLGGTRVKLGLVRESAASEVVAFESLAAESGGGLAARLGAIQASFDRLLSAAGEVPTAVGFATPGIVDHDSRRIVSINEKWADAPAIDLAAWARSCWGAPLCLENDANAALLGEWRFGAGRGSDDVAMMTLGTGIGCAAIMRGQPVRGRHGQAGILSGHLTVRVGGRLCTCGNRGCLEAEASTSVLPRIARESELFETSALSRAPRIDYEIVFELAKAGDVLATAIRDASLEAWSAGVVNLVHAFDPEVVVLGGGVMASSALILPSLEGYVHRHAWTPWGRVRLVSAERGDRAALLGVAWLAAQLTSRGDRSDA